MICRRKMSSICLSQPFVFPYRPLKKPINLIRIFQSLHLLCLQCDLLQTYALIAITMQTGLSSLECVTPRGLLTVQI